MGNWRRDELLALPDQCLEDGAQILERAAQTEWPQVLADLRMALIPKDPSLEMTPATMRPLGIASLGYRAWARPVARSLSEHLESILPDSICGFRKEHSAEAAGAQIQAYLDIAANAKPRYAVAIDLAKAFDSVDIEQTLESLKMLKVDPATIKAIRLLYRKLEDTGQAQATMEIPRGT